MRARRFRAMRNFGLKQPEAVWRCRAGASPPPHAGVRLLHSGTMVRIHPFRALRPQPSKAAQVAAVPYDVVSTAEARALAAGNRCSFLHVTRPEINLPDSANPYDETVYQASRDNLLRFIDEEILTQEDSPRLYLYRQVRNHRPQIGLVCCVHIEDYERDVIRKHEKTRKDKEDDRTRHVQVVGAHDEPVFLAYRDQPAIDKLVRAEINDRPLFHFNAPDGVTHTVWTVDNAGPYVDALARLDCAYVADGHHRCASAWRAGAERRAANPHHTGEEEYNWFLAVLFPASQLTILPYNRVVIDLNGQSPGQVRKRLEAVGKLSPAVQTQPDRPGVFSVYLHEGWWRLELDPATIDQGDAIAGLDVELLQRRVLEPILAIGDPRTDKRIDFVGGGRGTAELERRVNEGKAAIAFSLHPTTIDQLFAVSDAGLVMPPKSTWFEPKLRSGLFVHTLD
jgi:uncharacterized protein (DUF1015 family)